MNVIDKSENASTFDRIFKLLDTQYYKRPVIDEKITTLNDLVVDNYFLSNDQKEYVEVTSQKLLGLSKNIHCHIGEIGSIKQEMEEQCERIYKKADLSET